jgi:hypothetical protein
MVAACCPYCLGDNQPPIQTRLYQFYDSFTLNKHIKQHLESLEWPLDL